MSVTVVIRSVGERTTAICCEIARQAVGENNVVLVEASPFETALRQTYEVGINRGKKWTVTIDADVLPRPNAIQELISAAQTMPEYVGQIEGRIFDKLTGLYRQAGHRIYRTTVLPAALEHIPATGKTLRPEYFTLQQLEALGIISKRIDLVFGIHDFEQYYRDIYRKAFIYANKHGQWLPLFAERWRANTVNDADYRVALYGLCDGLLAEQAPPIDCSLFSQAEVLLRNILHLTEKPSLTVSSFDYSAIIRQLEQNPPPKMQTTPARLPPGLPLSLVIQKIGIWQGVVFSVGTHICRLGEKLTQWSCASDRNAK